MGHNNHLSHALMLHSSPCHASKGFNKLPCSWGGDIAQWPRVDAGWCTAGRTAVVTNGLWPGDLWVCGACVCTGWTGVGDGSHSRRKLSLKWPARKTSHWFGRWHQHTQWITQDTPNASNGDARSGLEGQPWSHVTWQI